MISELVYIAYFENLATQSKDFNHVKGTKDAFFYLPEPWDLTGIDNALKSTKSVPFMMLDSISGSVTEANSRSYTEVISGQVTILDMATVGSADSIRTVRDNCLNIGLKLFGRVSVDSRKQVMFGVTAARFNFNDLQFDPVGPIAQKHYGYTFRFKINCPFGFTVTEASWRDLEP